MGSTKTKQPEVLLGKYELGRLLGRGTFAKVYHARSLSDGAGVAVKVLDKPELVSSGAAPRILREVDAMRRLSPHPNIIRLHEVMATKTKIYLVMEHAAGGELLARLSRLSSGRLSEPSARRYFQQLLSALRFCHARGVAHRDVKPQNLLLDRHGCLKVSDFGLSALPDHLAADGRLHTSCGTPAYAAPEVLRGKGYDGARADAWSCGVILFVLLAGFLPFDDSNLALMYRKISKRDYRFPPWFPPSAKRIVSRLLDPNPETRISLGDLVELPWFKRSYSVDDKLSLLDSRPLEGEGEFNLRRSASAMNAFDIISMSAGLDLSGLFDKGVVEERRFSTKAPVETIVERIREAGAKLGYALGKGGAVAAPAGKIKPVLSVEVSEVVPPLSVVAMKVEAGGEGEKVSFSWNDLREELEDIIFAWHSNGDSDIVGRNCGCG